MLKILDIPPLGLFGTDQSAGVSNSNAVISTLFKAMGFDVPFPDRPAPGRDTILLNDKEINAVRKNSNLNPVRQDDEQTFLQDQGGRGSESGTVDGAGSFATSAGTPVNLNPG